MSINSTGKAINVRDVLSNRVPFAALLWLALPFVSSAATTIDFEHVCGEEAFGAYYTGGSAGSCSGSGPNYGVTFSGAIAQLQRNLGGSGSFSGAPSPPTAAFGQSIITADIPGGFISDVSFFYSNPYSTTTVRVFDQTGLRGKVLAQGNLPSTPQAETGVFGPFVYETLGFEGVARSIGVTSRGANGLYIDDLTFTPQPISVPEPGGGVMMLISATLLLPFGYSRRVRS